MTGVSAWLLRVQGAWDMTVGRALVMTLSTAIRAYQVLVSPLLGPKCRYHPTCSAYALAAIRTHGAVKGSLLTVGRLARCNPWTRGGVDHVPERGSWHGDKSVRPSGARVGS